MPRDYKQENKDLKVQRADLWKQAAKDKEIADGANKKIQRWRDKFYNLKKRIHILSTIKSSELGSDSD